MWWTIGIVSINLITLLFYPSFADAQEHLAKEFEKILLKAKTESYDKGYQEGANQKDNKPCVCGFWGDKK